MCQVKVMLVTEYVLASLKMFIIFVNMEASTR